MPSDLLHGIWWTTEQLASFLNVDPSTVRRWRTAHPLQGPPFIRLNNRLTLYSVDDVRHWLAEHRIDPGEVA